MIASGPSRSVLSPPTVEISPFRSLTGVAANKRRSLCKGLISSVVDWGFRAEGGYRLCTKPTICTIRESSSRCLSSIRQNAFQ